LPFCLGLSSVSLALVLFSEANNHACSQGKLGDVCRTRLYVPNVDADWEAVARAHGRALGEVSPANTLVGAALVGGEYLVEVELEAYTEEGGAAL